MTSQMLAHLRAGLAQRWEARQAEVLATTATLKAATGQQVSEAYRMAYDKAYWDGVIDIVEVALTAPAEHLGDPTNETLQDPRAY